MTPIISLWQPYASLIFADVKIHETRSFQPPRKYLGQTVGIHATAKFPPIKSISEDLHALCMEVFGCSYNFTLPQGCILGTVRISSCHSTNALQPFSDDDRTAGDWSKDRFAWLLTDMKAFKEPIPAKGKQGWWQHDCTPLPTRQGGDT